MSNANVKKNGWMKGSDREVRFRVKTYIWEIRRVYPSASMLFGVPRDILAYSQYDRVIVVNRMSRVEIK